MYSIMIQTFNVVLSQAKAELKEKEQDLQDLTVLLRSVKTERDQAVQVRIHPPYTLQTHRTIKSANMETKAKKSEANNFSPTRQGCWPDDYGFKQLIINRQHRVSLVMLNIQYI